MPLPLPPGSCLSSRRRRGEQARAILAPWALLDAAEPPLTFDIGALEPDDRADVQARGVGGHQEDAVPMARQVPQ